MKLKKIGSSFITEPETVQEALQAACEATLVQEFFMNGKKCEFDPITNELKTISPYGNS